MADNQNQLERFKRLYSEEKLKNDRLEKKYKNQRKALKALKRKVNAIYLGVRAIYLGVRAAETDEVTKIKTPKKKAKATANA